MEAYNNNNGTLNNQENGQIYESSIMSTKSSDNSYKNSSKKESLKLQMAQYIENNKNKIYKESNNIHIQKMKQNKEKEKDEEIEGKELIDKNELNINIEEFSLEIELIANLKKNFYKQLYKKQMFCDYRENKKKEWKIAFIKDILDDNIIVIRDIKSNKTQKIKIDEISKIAYFRKFSIISEENIFFERDEKKELKNKLETIENFIKENNFINNTKDIFEIYYFIHFNIFLGLDSAMKINSYGNNEGSEESFRIILNILLFISQYFKYLLDNKDDFIKYENNKNGLINSELIDLKVVNKKIAFFSFFGESIMLLNKILGNIQNYLSWYVYFEKKLQKFVPSIEDDDIKPNPKTEYYPIYEEQKNIYDNKNKLLLKKICLKNSYNLGVTYTTENTKIKATFLAYFIDYFYALRGFEYLFNLCYCDKSINIKLLLKLLNGLNTAKSMTGIYKNLYLTEKQQLLRFVYMFIDQLDEKAIIKYDNNDITLIIQKTSKLVALDKEEESRLIENMYFNYVSKKLLLSKKLDQKIASLNILNDILNNIEYNLESNKKYNNSYSDIVISKMSYQDFCVNCKKNQILKILLNEKSVHEEIIKRLPDIIFIMYQNNFGYLNKADEPKIKSDKQMIFNVLFNKLIESEQNNENNSNVINSIICDFSEILSEEDKFYFYNEIKNNFEKNIEKRGKPIKEQLIFLIDFSIKAISSKKIIQYEEKERKLNENKNIENKKTNRSNKNEESDEDEEEEEGDEIIDNDENSFTKEDDKLFNFKVQDKDYYFLNLLKSYLLEEEYNKYNMTNEQKLELINTSSEGIIKIIENTNKKSKELLLKDIFFKATGALEESKGVPQFLNLIDKLRKNNKINKKFDSILEDYSKDYGFLTSLMNDMTRYLCLVDSSKEKKNNLNNNKIEIDEEKIVYEGLFENKLNIELRLKLIIFLMENDEDESDLVNFKKLIKSCQSNTLAFNCLNKLIHSNIKKFEPIFIIFFYNNFLEDQELYDINGLQYYKLCKEIIKEINKINKIFYFMNDKDIAILNCESESKIKGINILWNFLIQTKNEIIRNDITDFLADIFLGIKQDEIEKNEKYWKNFIKTIYNILDEIIKNENKNDQAIKGIISIIKKIEQKSDYKGIIIEDLSEILNEIKINRANVIKKNKKKKKDNNIISKEYTFVGNSGGNSDKLLNYDIKIDNTEYFYMLRYKLSNFFKIPINYVKIVIDLEKYNKEIQKKFNKVEFDLFNDFSNTFSLFDFLEKVIIANSDENNNNKEIKNRRTKEKKEKDENKISIIFKVECIKSEKLSNIKKIIKNVPLLTKLLKNKNEEYNLDVWSLIKEESQSNNNINIMQNIKEILLNKDSELINSIFDFEETNIYYISYILSNLIKVINDFNQKDKSFLNKIFINKVWMEKINSIKNEINNTKSLDEIYENNNIIKYLLNIYKLISQKCNKENISILSKIIEFYYLMIKESININLKKLPYNEWTKVQSIEDLYIENSELIQGIIIENEINYKNFMKILISTHQNNKIKNQFEFLLFEGILKNKSISLNEKLYKFFLCIIDNKNKNINGKNNIDNNMNNNLDNEFYLYLLNFFLKEKSFHKLLNYIKEISSEQNLEVNSNIELYENNIKLYFEIIINTIEKSFPHINNKFNFNECISKIILPRIFKPIIEDIPIDLPYHEIILGGLCKLLVYILINSKNYKEMLNLEKKEEKLLKEYLFKEIILNKCNNNIYNENNLDNYKSISISTSYTFKQSVNLFVFLLIQNMESNDKNLEITFYLEKLTELHRQHFWKNEESSDWKLSFNENKKTTQFVGLKNLGCTCYMNSLLQVFFNIIPFRESLLKCECKEEKKNCLYQIKKLFFSLKYLKTNYFIPEEFTQNFDDEILNVHEQMDVDEFYINIIDKIENRLKNTKNENIIKYFFQGRQNDILTFQNGCTHHRTNTNNFYSIQLQIQNKKNIYESLDSLTEGELMNGDNCIFCPHCNKKLPVLKTQNFKSLPRILLFLLKRFEFNYDTMKKVKINDFYEFPLELDMTKYISEKTGKKGNNIYILKSIVVHMGNCENGHYYSFIKNKNEKWYEFNDTLIKPFDIKLLGEEAFGGEEVIYFNGKQTLQKKNRSAYLLFYEKKDQSDCDQFNNIDAINTFLKGVNNNIIINEISINNAVDNENNNILNKINETINNNGMENGGNLIEIKNNNSINGNGIKDILENVNREMFKYFLSIKLFSNKYQYFILEFFLNILNYYYNYDLPIFLMHLCRNERTTEIYREIHSFDSNLNLYLNNQKIILFATNNKKNHGISKSYYSDQILNLFRHFIIYFYNIFLKTKEKEYFGCMVDLLKFLINEHPICANYLIEEFCNEKTIIENLINCPLYDIKKLIVGILYCAMIKSVKDNEYSNIKDKNEKKKLKENNNKKNKILKEDETLARQLQKEDGDDYLYNFENNNPLEYSNIPKNLLKMIYNILNIIKSTKFNLMNEHRFLYFTIYRFSLISQNTREFLIYKCRLFELLCLLLHKNHQTNDYDINEICLSTFIGPYTVNHNILSLKENEKEELKIITDKAGIYKNENYIYMLFFYLLSYTPPKDGIKRRDIYDEGYSLENKDFISVLLNNIRTKQDAIGFSNYINEKSKDSKSKVKNVYEALGDCFLKVDNNDKINYEYNNYNNYVKNNMNENPNNNDPGINPKFLIMIFKKFILSHSSKEYFVKKGLKLIFELFSINQRYYSYSIMIIDLILELFSTDLKKYINYFEQDLDILKIWLENWPIPPSKYDIEGISMYKNMKINYDKTLSEEEKSIFNDIEINNTQKKIDKIYDLLSNDIKVKNENNKFDKDLDLSDF